MSNKRKSKRLDCYVPVEGQEGSIFAEAKTVDISKSGIGIISQHKIPINKEIPIELELSSTDDPVHVIGKVKWVREIEDSYRIGFIFKQIMFGSKTRLQKHFKKQSIV